MHKIGVIIVLLGFALSLGVYNYMPETMITHWGIDGEANGWMPKIWGLFLMPIICLILLGMFYVLPFIDPMKNIGKFRKEYERFIILILLFMLFIHIISILLNLGYELDIGSLVIIGIAGLIYYSGILLEKAKRNWFVGIRTPWTLSNEKVWNKTNKLGGRVFKIFGILMLGVVLLGLESLYYLIVGLVVVIICLFVYSYLEYKKVVK